MAEEKCKEHINGGQREEERQRSKDIYKKRE